MATKKTTTRRNTRKRTPVVPPPKDDPIHLFPDDSTDPETGFHNWIPTAVMAKMHHFVMFYLETGDSVGAVVKAGFAEESDDIQRKRGMASGLVRNDFVKRLMTQQYNAIVAKTGATVERIWQEIARIAFVDIGGAYGTNGEPLPFSEMPEDVRRAITGYKVVHKTFGEDGESIEKEIKFAGKDSALEKLCRLHRMMDADKLVVLDGTDFIRAMEEGRKRADSRP